MSVDAASNERDPLKRIAFIAAFAMSNYSSTIGRIAKPFNPMLVRTICLIVASQRLNILYREKHLNMLTWSTNIDTSRNKSAIILQYQHAGLNLHVGGTTEK
jgi:Oxysterol-binding protein